MIVNFWNYKIIIKVNFYMVLLVKMIHMTKDSKKKDKPLETKEKSKTELNGKTLHDLYRHATKLIE
jgi:hypothetical protein